MRLIHYTLTVFDAADEETDLVIFEEVLVGTQVSAIKRRREIIVKFETDRFSVQLRTDKEFDAWLQAFRDASRVATHYYKIVTTRQLGVGAFSTVYFGFDCEDGHHVAIKVVDKTQCSRAELLYAETEARMMAYVRHPSIVLCRDIFDAPDAMHVIMEYMSGDTLEQRMLSRPHNQRRFDEHTAATIMAHVLSALSYLEAERVCHRDVKPENILLSAATKDTLWATTARLSDFGLAAFINSDTELVDIVGTPHYVAPEVISRDKDDNEWLGYGPPVDVWAAGILLYWMLTGGTLPFDGSDSSAVFRAIRAAKLDLTGPLWNSISIEAKTLLRGLLHPNPATRLRASGAVCHPFLIRAHAGAGWVATIAQRFVGTTPKTPRTRLRTAIHAIRALLALGAISPSSEITPTADNARTGALRSERSKYSQTGSTRTRPTTLPRANGRLLSTAAKMARAPEQAPLGADGLGYNVGLIPSFAPKRRARAGGKRRPPRGATSGEGSGGDGSGAPASGRGSVESAVSSGSRTPSGERGASLDRKSVDSKGSNRASAWGFVSRARGSG